MVTVHSKKRTGDCCQKIQKTLYKITENTVQNDSIEEKIQKPLEIS